MASTEAGARLTQQQRRAQARISLELTAELRLLWPYLDLTNLDGTSATWIALVLEVVGRKHAASVETASVYLNRFREIEVGRTIVAFDRITIPLDPAVTTALHFTGPVRIKQGMTRGLSRVQAGRIAFSESARAAQLYVANGGREAIESGILRDKRCIGYQRVTDGAPCAFCAMLASRGPVYSKNSFSNVRVHIGCGCTLEPVYSRDTMWAGDAGKYEQIWRDSTVGLKGPAAEEAFRHAYTAAA